MADEVVAILVGHNKPADGDGGDETDDDLEPGDAAVDGPPKPKGTSGETAVPPPCAP